ncbi:hypothetical protein [Clostridium paraputrificum]|uniref:hypothetical protein n=1 Tax=Clostridium paraputrificum TaxID=29363 RepID=UPI001B3C8884|nr:hypothetical protein [Clostridium paraputrificum]DAE48836.1 MAG TPA: hypothetical protein [Caudoviricetes sp.]
MEELIKRANNVKERTDKYLKEAVEIVKNLNSESNLDFQAELNQGRIKISSEYLGINLDLNTSDIFKESQTMRSSKEYIIKMLKEAI